MAHAGRGVGRKRQFVRIDTKAWRSRFAQVQQIGIPIQAVHRLGAVQRGERVEHRGRHGARSADVHEGLGGVQHEHALHARPERLVLDKLRPQCIRGRLRIAAAARRQHGAQCCGAGAIAQHAHEVAALGRPTAGVKRHVLRAVLARGQRVGGLVHESLLGWVDCRGKETNSPGNRERSAAANHSRDLDLHVARQARHFHRGACRCGGFEVLAIHLVHGAEFVEVLHVDRGGKHVLVAQPLALELGADEVEHGAGLLFDGGSGHGIACGIQRKHPREIDRAAMRNHLRIRADGRVDLIGGEHLALGARRRATHQRQRTDHCAQGHRETTCLAAIHRVNSFIE
ncbi:hypothetical protein SDC9_144116 [bioreactor metagenome]|uniref:Uncharacterized protein n=1 Tax=bioreactor metagenome TaxID=1076179 RepID=A0A645E5Y8_9ZZZZ